MNQTKGHADEGEQKSTDHHLQAAQPKDLTAQFP